MYKHFWSSVILTVSLLSTSDSSTNSDMTKDSLLLLFYDFYSGSP